MGSIGEGWFDAGGGAPSIIPNLSTLIETPPWKLSRAVPGLPRVSVEWYNTRGRDYLSVQFSVKKEISEREMTVCAK